MIDLVWNALASGTGAFVGGLIGSYISSRQGYVTKADCEKMQLELTRQRAIVLDILKGIRHEV